MIQCLANGLVDSLGWLFAAQCLAAQKNGSPRSVFEALAAQVGWNMTTYTTTPTDATVPLLTILADSDDAVVLIGGVPSLGASVDLVNNFPLGPDIPFNYPINSTIRVVVDRFVVGLQSNAVNTLQRVTFVGYSFGGAVAGALGYYYKTRSPDNIYQVLTLGSPQWYRQGAIGIFPAMPYLNLFLPTDPIPYLPPTAAQAPGFYVGYSAYQARMVESWTVPGSRYQINAAAQVERQNQPTGDTGNYGLSLLGWATGLLAAPVEGHEIQSYVSYLARVVAVDHGLGIPLPVPRLPAPALLPPLPMAEQPAVMQPLPTPTVPLPTPTTPTTVRAPVARSRYVARKDGTPWGVWYKDAPVFSKMTKRSARALARKLNRAMKFSGAQIDPQVFLASVNDAVYDDSVVV